MQADLTAYLGGIFSQQDQYSLSALSLFSACFFSKLVSTVNAAPQPFCGLIAVNPRAASAVRARVIEDN